MRCAGRRGKGFLPGKPAAGRSMILEKREGSVMVVNFGKRVREG